MRKNILNTKSLLVSFAMMVVLACSSSAFGNATIVIVNADGVNEGFNDPTPAAPVGGNTGTTLGQQRLNAFTYAASIWGSTLDSNVTIRIIAAFNPLGVNVLGSAGPTYLNRDFGGVGSFPGSEFPATWYFGALADKRAGTETHPVAGNPDIVAQFSSDFNFYLGIDNNHGPLNDLVAVLLHEFGHGLNFANQVNESTGANFMGFTDVFARHNLDNTTGKTWDQMTQAERMASAVNNGRVVWTGLNVTTKAPYVLLFGSPEVKILTPAAIAGQKQFGTAAFGTPISLLAAPVTGTVVAAVDAADVAGPATTDGCSALTNAAAVAGNIALVERGTCGFVVKAKIAQDAGAIGVMIYNNAANAAAGPAAMGGVDATVIIPSISLSRADGLAIVGQLPGVTGFIGKDPTIRAGADAVGKVRLFMPNPVIGGSSGSHFDTIAFKNLLMEPSINPDLTHDVSSANGNDLTLELLRDVGWFPDANLDGVPEVVIGQCNSGVPDLVVSGGNSISDLILLLEQSAANHGAYVSGVAHLGNALRNAGIITGAQKSAIQTCAAGSGLPN
ncbi:MAG TPA: PA domain-containing protein [Pyrinomonadaceae bacterium]|nr:PA domain-containing protein [Pyrinomonadaceae bacterium]